MISLLLHNCNSWYMTSQRAAAHRLRTAGFLERKTQCEHAFFKGDCRYALFRMVSQLVSVSQMYSFDGCQPCPQNPSFKLEIFKTKHWFVLSECLWACACHSECEVRGQLVESVPSSYLWVPGDWTRAIMSLPPEPPPQPFCLLVWGYRVALERPWREL